MAFVGVGCFIATFINPLGWHIYEGLASVLGHFSQAYITEWWPYYRNITVPGSIPGIIYILIFVALELRYRGFCPVESRLLSWLFLFLGLYQFRYMSFFFIFSTVPLALHLDRLLPKQPNNFRVAKIVIGCRHHCGVRSAIGLYANRSGSRTSANAFRAGCSLSSNTFSACAASEPLELRWNFDLSHPRRHTCIRRWSSSRPLIPMLYCVTISSSANRRLMRPLGTRCLRNTKSIRCFG